MMGILFYVQTVAKTREKGAYGAGSPDGHFGRDRGIYWMSVRGFGGEKGRGSGVYGQRGGGYSGSAEGADR